MAQFCLPSSWRANAFWHRIGKTGPKCGWYLEMGQNRCCTGGLEARRRGLVRPGRRSSDVLHGGVRACGIPGGWRGRVCSHCEEERVLKRLRIGPSFEQNKVIDRLHCFWGVKLSGSGQVMPVTPCHSQCGLHECLQADFLDLWILQIV